MAKLILGFVGPIASGKGTACEYLVKKYQAGYCRFSTILRDILDRIYLEQSRDNLQTLSTILRQNFGDDLLAQAVAEDVKKDRHKMVVVDGVRRRPDIKYLKKIPGFYLVAIDALEKNRYDRIVKRSENTDDTAKTFKQFQTDGKQEAELQIKEVQAEADFVIDNNGTLENLYNQIDDIIKKINTN